MKTNRTMRAWPSRRKETSAVSCILGFRNFRKFVTSKSEKGGTACL